MEIDAELFRAIGAADPLAVERLALAASRRLELDSIRESARTSAVIDAPGTLIGRMKKFLRL